MVASWTKHSPLSFLSPELEDWEVKKTDPIRAHMMLHAGHSSPHGSFELPCPSLVGTVAEVYPTLHMRRDAAANMQVPGQVRARCWALGKKLSGNLKHVN